jgi:hypothetical protein
MRLLDVAADRLVGLLVPKTTAGACECRPEPWTQCCGPHIALSQVCQYDCNCKIYCGGCQRNPGCL